MFNQNICWQLVSVDSKVEKKISVIVVFCFVDESWICKVARNGDSLSVLHFKCESKHCRYIYTHIQNTHISQQTMPIICSELYFCPREINGKKEVYTEKYIFVHDSSPVWCIHESYWKYVPWNQRKQHVYTKNVPQSSSIKNSV